MWIVLRIFILRNKRFGKSSLKIGMLEKKARAKASLSQVLAPSSVTREQHTITKKTGIKFTILTTLPSDLLIISDCTDCEFVLGKTCTKVIIMNCTNSKFTFKATILTNCLEVISCTNVTITSLVALYTISADRTKDIIFDFKETGALKMIITNNVVGMVVKASGQEHCATTHSETDEPTTQYFTGWVAGRITTDLVVRQGEGGSLVTTQTEAKQFEEQQAQAAVSMESYVRSMFKFSDKSEEDKK